MSKRNKFLKVQLTAAIFALIIVLISGFFIFGPELSRIASALTGNYNKLTGDNLDVNDWNNLDDDFVAKSGDTMTGALTLPADPTQNLQAATKHYVDNIVSSASSIEDTSGNPLRMVCGQTYLNTANTIQYGQESYSHIRVTVDTSAAAFTSIPYYYASLGGSYVYGAYGASGIYPSIDFFRVVLTYLGDNLDGNVHSDWGGGYLTPTKAINFGSWYINWCALGQ